jgi:hypothetical protein
MEIVAFALTAFRPRSQHQYVLISLLSKQLPIKLVSHGGMQTPTPLPPFLCFGFVQATDAPAIWLDNEGF